MLSSQSSGYYCFVHKEKTQNDNSFGWLGGSHGAHFKLLFIVSIPSCWDNMDPRNTPSNINRGVACAHDLLHSQSRHNLIDLLETLCSIWRPGHVFLDHCKESPQMGSWKQQKFFSHRSLKWRCPQGHICPGCREGESIPGLFHLLVSSNTHWPMCTLLSVSAFVATWFLFLSLPNVPLIMALLIQTSQEWYRTSFPSQDAFCPVR